MLSDKPNIINLVALLQEHGVTTAVVCPGSRNAPIVRSMSAAGMRCFDVTDERSAAFYALGMAEALGDPVALCVTSGSALLNTAPALVEAKYRNIPVIAISADRPAPLIGQLQGQTIDQPAALASIVKKMVDLPEPHDATSDTYCIRLINEAILSAKKFPCGPVHINVPVSAPLFGETTDKLPWVKKLEALPYCGAPTADAVKAIASKLMLANSPMIIIGQYPYSQSMKRSIELLRRMVTVISEPLGDPSGGVPFEKALFGLETVGALQAYLPDFILYCGGNIVSNKLRQCFGSIDGAESYVITPDGEVCDVLGNLTTVVQGDAAMILEALAKDLIGCEFINAAERFRQCWQQSLDDADYCRHAYKPRYSQMLVVKMAEKLIYKARGYRVHYANSSAVRLGNLYAHHYIYVNRGVNGIEGSLSAAAGHSLVTDDTVVCIIGDLSFFYDSNALWNSHLRGNLRILLLNNHKGSVFYNVKGMPQDAVTEQHVIGSHSTDAEYLCKAYNIGYARITNEHEAEEYLPLLLREHKCRRPVLIEAVTDADFDAKVYAAFLSAPAK